jgi:hypothetical protein
MRPVPTSSAMLGILPDVVGVPLHGCLDGGMAVERSKCSGLRMRRPELLESGRTPACSNWAKRVVRRTQNEPVSRNVPGPPAEDQTNLSCSSSLISTLRS